MKIITALENKKINEKLKKINKYAIINNDILYQEAVIDILEKEKNINYLFLNINLPGELEKIKFINKIIEKNNKIKIIIFLKNKNKKIIDEFVNNIQIKFYEDKNIKFKKILKILKEMENKYHESIGKYGQEQTIQNKTCGLHNTKKPNSKKLKKTNNKNIKYLINNSKIIKKIPKIKIIKNIFHKNKKINQNKLIKNKLIYKKELKNKINQNNNYYKINKLIKNKININKLNNNNKLNTNKLNNNKIITISGPPGVR